MKLFIFLFTVISYFLISCNPTHETTFEPNRLEKISLSENLEDPMEIAVSKDGMVFIIERKGKIKLYNPILKRTKTIGKIEVDLGHEDGLLGLTIDPNFESNGYVYLLYTPTPHYAQRVSRFIFDGEKLNISSEKIIIEYPIVPERHQGGSLLFDNHRNLFITTGENTVPTEINGYAPIDERMGHEKSDAQRSAGNTNDLRGKILRIHINEDGSYSIPKGNFKEKYSLQNSKPEIYVMGCRNPFRATFDNQTQTLYWGEIGPDAGSDSPKGPKGHDEINRASEAGFYGWPYFIGNSKPYAKVDFNTDKIIYTFNSLKPENSSPNNTGEKVLPPPHKALIWYPYDESVEFPILGKGGRSAMAGMVYHRNLHKSNEFMLHDYFENKLFIMDWMRNWIMTVSFDSINQLKSIEPFMPNTVFERPMDMALGNDGCMYLLEYGTNWFDNKNGKLSKIIYNRNNRNPVVQLSIPNTKGGLPFQLNASAKDSYDPDNDSLTYKWYLNNELLDNHSPLLNYTIEKAGKHELILEISDSKNTKSTKKIDLIIGNNEPILNLKIDGNSTFYNPQSIISFESYATDKEDGNNLLTINELRVVHASFIAQNISSNSIFCRGKKLVETSDCFACHAMNTKSVGPDFITLNNKYEPNEETIAQLSQKVKNGGSGVWGNVAMSAHPQLSNDQTALMVRYILSNKNIENNQVFSKSSSKISQKLSIPLDENLFVKLKSSYTDKGANNMLSHTTSDSILLQYPSLMALSYDLSGDVIETNGLARLPFPGSFVCFKAIDLTLIRSIEFEYSYDFFAPNCEVEIHVDAPTGTLIGKTSVKKINSNSKFGKDKIELIAQNSKKDLYIVYKPALDLHAPINFKKFNFIF